MTFEEFVSEHGHGLLRLARVLTGDKHLAEDLVQSALIRALRKWSSVERAESPVAYVRKILVNQHLSWRRRRWNGEVSAGLPHESWETTDDPAEIVVSRQVLRELLNRVGPRARTVLVLRYYAEQSDADIAAMLDMSEGSVRATASRALAALRRSVVERPVEEIR